MKRGMHAHHCDAKGPGLAPKALIDALRVGFAKRTTATANERARSMRDRDERMHGASQGKWNAAPAMAQPLHTRFLQLLCTSQYSMFNNGEKL